MSIRKQTEEEKAAKAGEGWPGEVGAQAILAVMEATEDKFKCLLGVAMG